MTENVFVKKHRQRMASCCDACHGPLVWIQGRLQCAKTTCKLYAKDQIIKRPPKE